MNSLFLFVITIVFAAAHANDYINPYSIGRGLFTRLHYLTPPSYSAEASADEQWFEQRLDHFNALDTNVWWQRYFSRYGDYMITVITSIGANYYN